MKHQNNIDYPGGFNQLTEDLGNLSYDALEEFLNKLSTKIAKDSKADKGRERLKLAKQLSFAAKHIGNAWKICKPHMN